MVDILTVKRPPLKKILQISQIIQIRFKKMLNENLLFVDNSSKVKPLRLLIFMSCKTNELVNYQANRTYSSSDRQKSMGKNAYCRKN